MVVSREPHINLRDINAVLQEHGKMLKLRYARIITPKGYEPMEVNFLEGNVDFEMISRKIQIPE